MKKIIFLIASLVLTITSVMAQYHSFSDTLTGLSDQYYYDPKYDGCPWIQTYSDVTYHEEYIAHQRVAKLALVEYPDRRMAVKGIAAMVTPFEKYNKEDGPVYFYSPNPGKKAEYVYLCTGDTSWLHVMDSARWDTLTPRLWRFPNHQDTTYTTEVDSFLYCHLFEAYFDSAILVDSTFIMAGSYYSNSDNSTKTYIPTSYYHVSDDYDRCVWGCNSDSLRYLYIIFDTSYMNRERESLYDFFISHNLEIDKEYIERTIDSRSRFCLNHLPGLGHLGPFFAIVDFYHLGVAVNDSQKGWGLGGGRYPARSLDTIMARPKPGFCFVQWDDGNTDNPRVVDLSQDTLFTAVFDTCPPQGIATPAEPPLPFTVIPNPTTASVIVGTPSDGSYQLTLYDMAGRLLMQTSFTGRAVTLDLGHLAAGNYQLMLRSDAAGASGIKVIVKQ